MSIRRENSGNPEYELYEVTWPSGHLLIRTNSWKEAEAMDAFGRGEITIEEAEQRSSSLLPHGEECLETPGCPWRTDGNPVCVETWGEAPCTFLVRRWSW